MKKILSTFIAVSMLASIGSASAATIYKDTNGHWAENQINNWSNYGVISGYDGMFSPNRSITRGEFAVVLNRLMNYQNTQENTFSDLDNNFYTDSVLKLNKAGVMQGYEKNISPNANLTRQEAASLICRALGIAGQKKANKTFADSDDVSEWARASMNAMINLGLINGADGKLNPQNTITRAEVVTILDNAVLPVLSSGETADIETDKILVISTNDVVIKDSKISGKVIITQGVTKGNVEFVNTEIEEDITVDNSRKEFVVLKNTIVNGETVEEGIYTPSEKEPTKEDEKPAEDNQDDDKSSQGGSNGGGGGNSGGGKEDKEDPKDPEPPVNPENPEDPKDPEPPVEPEEPDTPDEPEEPVKDPNYYITLNAEMVSKISDASADMAPYLTFQNLTFTPQEKYLLTIIKNCMDETIKFQDKKIINKSFLKEEFPDEIDEVKNIYDEMEAAGISSAFTEKLVINLNSATIEWLADAFGLLD